MVTLTRFSTSNPETPLWEGWCGLSAVSPRGIHTANHLRSRRSQMVCICWVSFPSPDPKEEAPSKEHFTHLWASQSTHKGCSMKSERLSFTECWSCTSVCLLPCAFSQQVYQVARGPSVSPSQFKECVTRRGALKKKPDSGP